MKVNKDVSSPSTGASQSTGAKSKMTRPSQQVLVFGLPESVPASVLQVAIVKAGVKRVFVKLITKVCTLYCLPSSNVFSPRHRRCPYTTLSSCPPSILLDEPS